MKKIKSISILLEQGPPDLSALQSGTITTPTTQPTDGKRKTGDKKNDGSGTTQPDQESSSPSQEELKTKPPYVDLLKLPGSQIKEKVDFSGET